MNPIDRAINGSSQAPLTTKQRRLLMARYIVPAHRRRVATGLTGEALEPWRREEQFKACHKTHLRQCTQADWLRLTAHFLGLMGRRREAEAAGALAACGGLAVAQQKLRAACAEARDVIEQPERYAAAIARARYNTTALDELSERQLWTLCFDMRRAAQRRREHEQVHQAHG